MNTPVVLFLFKRYKSVLQILDVLRKVQPKTIYLVSDAGRNDIEQQEVMKVRKLVEGAINWKCNVYKDYATENRGVFDNIGMGALRVFQKEQRAIFLEDDNLPEETFFEYCEELLDMYEKNEKILWICGTNYYEKMPLNLENNFFFTQHLLPCGWASWGNKFKKFYDSALELVENPIAMGNFKQSYRNKILYKQQLNDIMNEYNRKMKGERYLSWDYHMLLSIRAQGLMGIAPRYNQIKNIGVDSASIHGGSSMMNIMTRRFCEIPTRKMPLPLKKEKVYINKKADYLLTKKIVYPCFLRMRISLVNIIKHLLKMDNNESLKQRVKRKIKK